MGDRFRRRLSGALATAMAMLMLSPQLGALSRLPDEMVLDAGTVTVIPVSTALRADASGDEGAITGEFEAGAVTREQLGYYMTGDRTQEAANEA